MRDAYNNHPLLVIADSVVDDLAPRKVLIAVEHLLRRDLRRVENVPVINASVSNKAKRCFTEPLSAHHIFLHRRALDLALLRQIKDLQRLPTCFQSDHLLGPMHDGTIRLNRASNDILSVLEVDDDDLGRGIVIYFLPHADVVVGFECTRVESY